MKHRYILRISFNDYVGNFQREFDAHVLNYINDYYSGVLNAAIAHGIEVENAHKRAEQALTNKNDARMLLDFAFERVLKGTGEKD